ncbi:MAG TPA: hypothetical protein VFA78_03855 [Chloroflexota bacterium]|nr:hypothetical protein [Chloroflexota bacterium]
MKTQQGAPGSAFLSFVQVLFETGLVPKACRGRWFRIPSASLLDLFNGRVIGLADRLSAKKHRIEGARDFGVRRGHE